VPSKTFAYIFLSQRLFLPISLGNGSTVVQRKELAWLQQKHAGVGRQNPLASFTNNGRRKISNMSSGIQHPKRIPYEIDPEQSRAHFYETYWKRVCLELLLKHTQPNLQAVLDYGCGRGESIQLFSQAGFQVTGADVDPECVKLGSRFGKAVVLDSEDPVGQFGPKSFDIVTCFHVLEHVDNPKKTLNELRAMSRKYVLLAVPNLRYLHLLFARTIDLGVVNEGHLQSWDHWHFRSLAERHCGLRLVEWGFDATAISGLSGATERLFGKKAAIWLETGIFRRLFPFHGISVIGLFEVSTETTSK